MRNNYVFELDRKVVALIMNDIGFHSASTIALDGLSRVFSERMRVLCKAVALFAGHAGRTKPVLEDVGLAFSWMGISLREIVDYCAQTKPTSVLLRIPRFPVKRPRKLKFGNDSVDSDGRLACIPESLPEPSLETEVSKVETAVETADEELKMSLTGKGTNSRDIIDWESMDSVSLGLVDQATVDMLKVTEEEEEEEEEQDYEEEEYEYEEELDEEKETEGSYGREKRREIFVKKNYQANVKLQPVVSKSKSSKSKKKKSKKQDRSFMLPASSANIEASIETIISSALSEVSGNSETKLDIPTAATATPEDDKEQRESEEMDTTEDTTSGSQSSQSFAIVEDQADDGPGRPVVLTLRSISEKRKAKDMTKPDVEPVKKKKKKKKKKKHHDDSEATVTSISEAVPSSSVAEAVGAVKLRIKISNLSLDFDVKEKEKKKKKKKKKKEKERKNKHTEFVQSVVEEEEKQAHAEMKVPKLIIKWQTEDEAVVSVKQEEKSSQAEVEVDGAGATLASDLSYCSNLPASSEQVHLSNVGRFPQQSTELEKNETTDDDWYCPYCFLGERKGVAMVGCDGCDNWFHYDCAGVITEPPSNEPWYCNGCSGVRSRVATTSGAVPALSLALKKVTNGSLKKKKKKRT